MPAARLRHGHWGTDTHKTWSAMISRAKGHNDRKLYADKGIGVCERWLTFTNFLEDMGERPFKKASLDRIDGTKGYSPENCRWADWFVQAKNRTTSHQISLPDGRVVCVGELARETGMHWTTLEYRLFVKRMPLEEAIKTPLKVRRVVLDGVEMAFAAACRIRGLPPTTVRGRIALGWSEDAAFNTPPKIQGNSRQQDS